MTAAAGRAVTRLILPLTLVATGLSSSEVASVGLTALADAEATITLGAVAGSLVRAAAPEDGWGRSRLPSCPGGRGKVCATAN